MNYEQIEKLIDKVNKSKITELSVEEGRTERGNGSFNSSRQFA